MCIDFYLGIKCGNFRDENYDNNKYMINNKI